MMWYIIKRCALCERSGTYIIYNEIYTVVFFARLYVYNSYNRLIIDDISVNVIVRRKSVLNRSVLVKVSDDYLHSAQEKDD
ncbi:MAG: hypothetical protein D6711_10165 [Chloroflexi bacterium]|nr:MAG: hypothetical protein D6711_10165 [Chloroflexota bacterium]